MMKWFSPRTKSPSIQIPIGMLKMFKTFYIIELLHGFFADTRSRGLRLVPDGGMLAADSLGTPHDWSAR